MKKLILFLLMPVSVMASEADSYCRLTTEQAQIRAEVLGSAEAFSTAGNQGTDNTLVVGVRKSFSNSHQAELTRELAQVQCTVYAAQQRLRDSSSGFEARAELLQLRARAALLQQAKLQAQSNLRETHALLGRQDATLQDYKADSDQLGRISIQLSQDGQRMALLTANAAPEDFSLLSTVDEFVRAESASSRISGELAAGSGWDLSISAGGQRSLQATGPASAFAAVSLTRSFGYSRATQAATEVAALTQNYLTVQREGPVQQLARMADYAKGALKALAPGIDELLQKQTSLQELVDRVSSVDTHASRRLSRGLALEQKLAAAELAGEQARQSYFKSWLARNAATSNSAGDNISF